MNGYVKFTWSGGKWNKGEFVPAPYQLLHINAGALHYGISVFEGMKAFACKDGKIRLMNPTLNAKRMQEGANALLMPQVPESLFVNAVKESVRRNREFVPPHGFGASMYIRPLLFASGPMLGLAPLASEYTFFVTVMPTGGYFGAQSVKAIVSENHDRAAPKGTGGVKAGGNYAADLTPVHAARKAGYGTTLYLDAKERKYIEEFSVCNFIGITHDNRFVTPKSGTILRSTTNRMLQQLAKDRGMVVEERPVAIDELSSFKEVGMCGTAAVIVMVESITRGDHTWKFEAFDTIASLRREFQGIQAGDLPDRHKWMAEICDFKEDGQRADAKIGTFTPGMQEADDLGAVQKLGADALHGLERALLEHVVHLASKDDVESVLLAMDSFWNERFEHHSTRWNVRTQTIEEAVIDRVAARAGSGPVRCVELGSYCGYSALRIARLLPEGSTLLSVEKDPLFAAIATKIIEFAGLQHKVKIWIGTVQEEISEIMTNLGHEPADFVLVDHAKDRFVPDLQLLQESGVVDGSTRVLCDVEVYPLDEPLRYEVQEEISDFFDKSPEFVISHMM